MDPNLQIKLLHFQSIHIPDMFHFFF
eukprot:SAG31_NODE_19181_length_610_cov_0.706458_1_plen_25_part_10